MELTYREDKIYIILNLKKDDPSQQRYSIAPVDNPTLTIELVNRENALGTGFS